MFQTFGEKWDSVMTSEVTGLYEMFPFPSPEVGTPLVDVVADQMPFLLGDNCLDGWRMLDAGCGTGHILVALALRYPKAYFIGLDACQRSLDIARHLAEYHGANNVEFVQGTIPDLDLPNKFDLITCFGVLHHMPDPRAGLRWLSEHLADDGLLHLWLYNALGEHGRMLDRELALLFTSIDEGKSGLETVHALGITLPQTQYGLPADQTEPELSAAEQDVFDADAYLNPICPADAVHRRARAIQGPGYRMGGGRSGLFRRCRQVRRPWRHRERQRSVRRRGRTVRRYQSAPTSAFV
jgi:SAM-dependent methyltransferase